MKQLVDLVAQLSAVPFILSGNNANAPFSPWLNVGFFLAWHGTLAAVLIFAARPIAEAIFGRRTVAAHDLGLGAWMMLIVSGIGLAFALFSLQDAGQSVVQMVARFQANVGRPLPRAIEPSELAVLVVPILKVGLGVLLFLRPSLLVTPWLRGIASR